MKTIDQLNRLVLDKTGAFLFSRPTDEDIRDLDNLLKTNIRKVIDGFSYPFLRLSEKKNIQEEEGLFYITLPEGSLVDVTLEHLSKRGVSIMYESDIALTPLGDKLYFDRKPADFVYITYVPYIEIDDDYKLDDSLVDCVVSFTFANWLEQREKPEADGIKRQALYEEELAIHKATKTFNNKIIFKK